MKPDYKKYSIAFLITVGIFIVVFALVNLVNNKKLSHLTELQQKISVDLIATETQFDLLKSAPCSSVGSTVLSRELGEFGQKLDYAESRQGSDSTDVIELKKHYSLLQIKDYLLMQELAAKCGTQVDSLLYFYGHDCPECTRQGYVLTEFKKEYPDIRIYSFDGDLDFSVIETFAALYSFDRKYPTLIVDNKIYQEFHSLEDLEKLFPEAVKEKELEETIEAGKAFILASEDYQSLNGDNLSFVAVKNDIYEYSYLKEGVAQTISLEYDDVSKTFDFFVAQKESTKKK